MASSVHELTRAQTTVARRSAESRATVPDLTLGAEVELDDAHAALSGSAWRAEVVRAAGRALSRHPRANGAYKDGAWELRERVNVGVAMSYEDAFVHPVVFDASSASREDIEARLRALGETAAAGRLTRPDLSGATFTVADAGGALVTELTPAIVPPHAGALGVGAVRSVPVVAGGEVVPGHVVKLTLACDHRILYGEAAAAFLGDVAGELRRPLP